MHGHVFRLDARSRLVLQVLGARLGDRDARASDDTRRAQKSQARLHGVSARADVVQQHDVLVLQPLRVLHCERRSQMIDVAAATLRKLVDGRCALQDVDDRNSLCTTQSVLIINRPTRTSTIR